MHFHFILSKDKLIRDRSINFSRNFARILHDERNYSFLTHLFFIMKAIIFWDFNQFLLIFEELKNLYYMEYLVCF